MRRHLLPLLTTLPLVVAGCQRAAVEVAPQTPPASVAATQPAADPAHGEYLVVLGGCNDCHTDGYGERAGEVPRDQWLTGSPVGFHGPWGTSYPTNLRLSVDALDESQWLAYTANLHTRPLMPDYMLRAMREDDRRAIYRFIRSLGPAGEPAPAALPPGEAPPPPYFQIVLPPV